MKLYFEIKEEVIIKQSEDVHKYLQEFINEDKEYFIVLGLNTKNRILYRDIVHIGTLNQTIIHPREIFKRAIQMSADKIIVAHNHPSGDTTPSDEDIQLTKKLQESGEIIGIKLLDHIIIGENKYESIKVLEE